MTFEQANLAYLLGALYGDGSFSNERIFFGVTDRDFVEAVANTVKKLFGIELTIRTRKLSLKNPKWKDYFHFSSRKIYSYLEKYNPKINNELPRFIKKGNLRVKSAFLKGFFDAEGNVDIRSVKRKDGRTDVIRHVKGFSNNTKMLNEIKQILSTFDIKSKIFRGKKNNYYICIWNYRSLKIFNENIGFVIKRKQLSLEKALNSYKEIQTRWNFETYKKVMNLGKTKGIGAKKIKQELSRNGFNIPQPTIEAWIYGKSKIT